MKPRVWNITAIKEKLGLEICNNILFLHAILGCDTTSQLYGIGRGTSLKKFKSSKHFQMQAKVFSTTTSTPHDIMAAGEQVLVDLYSRNLKEGLNCLRYKCFCEKVAKILHLFYHKLCHLLQMLLNIIVSMHISKYKSGKVMPVKCSQLHGDGKTMMEN